MQPRCALDFGWWTLRLTRVVLLVLLMSLGSWADSDDFCGSGVHPQHASCHCAQQHKTQLCLCHWDPQAAVLTAPLRERLPALANRLQISSPQTGVSFAWVGSPLCLQVPLTRSDAPAVPPPR